MPRRLLILILLSVFLASCGGGGGSDAPSGSEPVDAEVVIDNRPAAMAVAPPVNRRVLGSNVQWTDGGDSLLQPGSSAFAPAQLAGAIALAPTVIRYPGGGQADAFHWANGEGAVRGTSMHVFTRGMQTIWFGTGEFLDLCQQTGAAPLITVNTQSATAAESAAWVTRCNGLAPFVGDPVVRDWEIGNEPYLENTAHPEDNVTAAQFVAAYNAHAAAVIAADPRVRIGLPVMGPIMTGLVPADRRTWNADVFAALTQRVDFVAVHNAYLPFYYPHDRVPSDTEMLPAILAAAVAVDADLDTLRTQLTAAGIGAPFAMTEFNSLVTVFGGFTPIPRSDGTTASLAGAVYLADLICTLARRDDVDSAQHWSLISNWLFGAMYYDGAPRPAYRALQGLGSALVGSRLQATVSGPTADVAAFGAQPALTAIPLVSAFATGSSGTVRTVLVNRSPDRALRVRLRCRGGATAGATASVRTLNASDPLAEHNTGTATPDWIESAPAATASGLTVDLPAHSLVIVTLPAPTAAAAAPAPVGDG